MFVTMRTFYRPKSGNTDDEYEDAFWPNQSVVNTEVEKFRCAVADGATEASFSANWARLLTEGWCRQSVDNQQFIDELPHLTKEWQKGLTDAPLAWYAEEKARSGAFSSLLGLELIDGRDHGCATISWTSLAVGDSCLFQIRKAQLVVAFPMDSSASFNNSPFLISTASPATPDEITDHFVTAGGECQPGDIFYLMTDALACWFLRVCEDGEPAIDFIADINEQKHFADFTGQWRTEIDDGKRPYLRNDDVTLLRVEIHE